MHINIAFGNRMGAQSEKSQQTNKKTPKMQLGFRLRRSYGYKFKLSIPKQMCNLCVCVCGSYEFDRSRDLFKCGYFYNFQFPFLFLLGVCVCFIIRKDDKKHWNFIKRKRNFSVDKRKGWKKLYTYISIFWRNNKAIFNGCNLLFGVHSRSTHFVKLHWALVYAFPQSKLIDTLSLRWNVRLVARRGQNIQWIGAHTHTSYKLKSEKERVQVIKRRKSVHSLLCSPLGARTRACSIYTIHANEHGSFTFWWNSRPYMNAFSQWTNTSFLCAVDTIYHIITYRKRRQRSQHIYMHRQPCACVCAKFLWDIRKTSSEIKGKSKTCHCHGQRICPLNGKISIYIRTQIRVITESDNVNVVLR